MRLKTVEEGGGGTFHIQMITRGFYTKDCDQEKDKWNHLRVPLNGNW